MKKAAFSTMPGGTVLRQGAADGPRYAGQCFPAGSSNLAADGWCVRHQPSKANSCQLADPLRLARAPAGRQQWPGTAGSPRAVDG